MRFCLRARCGAHRNLFRVANVRARSVISAALLPSDQVKNKDAVERLLRLHISSTTAANDIIGLLLAYARGEGASYDSIAELMEHDDAFWLEDVKLSKQQMSKVKSALSQGQDRDKRVGPNGSGEGTLTGAGIESGGR